MRLNKFLAKAGIASRRAADTLIEQGEVMVNGKVTQKGQQVDEGKDRVEVSGKRVQIVEEKIYLALNKPVGYTTTRKDKFAEKTIYDLLPKEYKDLIHPVGRLDKDSSGLLLLTNDGDLTQRLTHPKFEHQKEYRVIVKPAASEKDLHKLENGVEIDGKKTSPAQLRLTKKNKQSAEISVKLTEGMNRQIRKMFALIGSEVIELERVRIEKLQLQSLNLKPGEFTKIAKEEIL